MTSRSWALVLVALGLLLSGSPDPRLARLRWIIGQRSAASPGAAADLERSGSWARDLWRRFRPAGVARTAHAAALRQATRALIDELDGGSTAADAFRTVARQHDDELGAVLCELAVASERGEFSMVASASSLDRVDSLRLAVSVALRTGCSVRRSLAGVLDEFDAELGLRSAVQSATAGPRSASLLLAVLPTMAIGLGVAMGADPVGVLTGSAVGRGALVVGGLFEVAGVLWTQRLIRRVQPW